MATTVADTALTRLPYVRRLEAAGFRAWPASKVTFDGAWQLRLTPGHPSKRLNCLVPLDPFDANNMPARVLAACSAFEAQGLKPAIRQSPLCPPELPAILTREGWVRRHETLVLAADLEKIELGGGMDHLPTRDIQRFSEACVRIDDRETTAPVLAGIISSIQPTAGLFLMEGPAGPTAVGICVQDNDLAGLQQLVVAPAMRRQGLGREIVTAALRWAKLRGARYGWLQVVAENHAALALYEGLGFAKVYDYAYWQRGD
ncbi:GNAT family N-acetyltransferase [Rhizobium sp. KVB221]|uniref:GNAT family N-acetyltransferase n=1 Tax=Rhizobium setariae TaxID=2801340 RepID=A0A936YQ07_9HYPH|nr:GNAT family N-acetyltransferase [Rhizobium setariae]MBL0374684.1 GNAT family N-acetyltransferase [Rhizobium setariae]